MKKELIDELFQKFEAACYFIEDTECWSARELQVILGYNRWENFINAIEKAKKSCESAGEKLEHHFRDITKMVEIGSGSQRPIEDLALNRYACYLIAQNGDPTKKQEIAFAQTYFAVQTRRQEIIEQRLLDLDRVTARDKLSKTENKLSGVLYERGVDEKGFAIIRSEGDKALFGGRNTQDMKRKLAIPESRPLADFLPTLTIKAKDFAAELTHHNVVDKDLRGQPTIQREHIDNNLAVRRILNERGVKPENLPPDEDVKKVERRIKSDDKKAVAKPDKIKNLNTESDTFALKNTMHITNSTLQDHARIFELYDDAIAYQKKVFNKTWKGFDHEMVKNEIEENRQWKIVVDDQIACIFAITFNDAAIWAEKDQNDGIYIHRIVTNPDFRGANFVKTIVAWAIEYAKSLSRKCVRMDTWGDNQRLIDYYQECGFRFLGIITPDASGLPKHYTGIQLSLFEIEV
jgi:DNA-damage-inducible protein D